MEGLRPFLVLHMFLCSAKSTHFVSNLEKNCEHAILGKYAKIISILHRGDFLNLLQYYIGGRGSAGTPNLYYVINGWPLRESRRQFLPYIDPKEAKNKVFGPKNLFIADFFLSEIKAPPPLNRKSFDLLNSTNDLDDQLVKN